MSHAATRVLLVEDNQGDARLIRELFAEAGGHFALECVDSLASALERLDRGGVDAVLLDLVLPDGRGLETLVRLRAGAPAVPVVVLTGTDDEVLAVQAVRGGAQDYLVKGQVDGHLIARSIRYAVERKKSAEALWDSEEQFRAVAESAGEAIITTAVGGKITFWNRAATRVFGYTAEEIVGRPLTVLIPERYHARHRAGIARFVATGDARVTGETLELEGLRKDGVEFPLELSIGMWSTHGEPQFSAIIHDMTERIEAEDLVERLSRRNELILTSAGEGIFGVDRDGRATFVNPTAALWLGHSASDMLGLPIHPMIHPCTPDGVPIPIEECEVLGVLREGETRRGETAFWRADGTHFPVRYVSTAIVDAGEIRGAVVLFEDISEHKVSEAALAEANNIISLSPAVAFLWKNEEGWPVEYVSRNVKDLFGYTADEFMGRHVPYTSVIHADDQERVRGQNSTYSKEKRRNEFTQEYRIVTKDGQVRWVDDRTRIRRNEKGEITHYQGIVLDITERRRAEESIRELNMSLERRVAERTTELETANRELEAFVYSVSHDLKAPLRAIDGYSCKLTEELKESLNPEGRRLLNVVRQRTQHMGRLIDDLLAFSRIGRATLTCTDVDMGKLAQSTFEEIAATSAGRKIEFAVGDLPTICTDFDLIRQVWANLLDNAIKFTGQREVARIEVGYREEADEHVFFVQDNGAGFEMEYVDKLFGVFQRLHYEDEFPGTGVGLANVRRIVERHGGEAWAEGEVDRGATIFFRLPRTEGTM